MMDAGQAYLSTVPSGHGEHRLLALSFVLISGGIFLAAAPFAKAQLPAVPAFLPVYQSALVINDLITAALLFGQLVILRSRALLVLACGYIFSACMAASHALSFPGLFSPTGLLGAGPQTTAWIYFLWHAGFPLFIVGYALLRNADVQKPIPAGDRMHGGIRRTILAGVAATLAFAGGLTLLATAGHDALPVIMRGDADASEKIVVASVTWALILLALVVLSRRRSQSVLDLLLMVVLWAWIFDVALAAVFNHGRYDLGWYAGRIYGLLAASFVLVMLLIENGRLYARLAETHAREREERRLVEDRTTKLMAANRELDASNAALRDSSTRIQSIVDTVADGIITIDERGVIQTINPAAERAFGYTASELIGSNVNVLMPEPYHSQDDGYLERQLERYRTIGESHVIGTGREVTGRRKDGSIFPLELAVREMKLGDRRHYTGAVHDITERKETDRKLVAAKIEAENANVAKDRFLATMSHEIRTPLNALLGTLELLSFSSLDAEQRESLQIARDSGRGLVRIIDDVLDHAKIVAGKLEFRLEPVSVAKLVRRVVNTYKGVASARNLTLKQTVDPQISPSLMADPLRVLQILNNLVGNALKFTDDGCVEIRAERVGQTGGAETIRLSVTDTGIGMAPEVQARLFQPFEQAYAVTGRLYGGTGLGLSISRRLAEMMGSTIEVNSTPGKGTTLYMTLTLPISESQPAEVVEGASIPVAPLVTAGECPLVLAVDDHPTNCRLLARQLATLGLRVRRAANGNEALEQWKGGEFAMIITDCNMPGMDGYALSRTIRAIETTEDRERTPIIAWTANVLPDAAAQCRLAGMDDVLTKPVELATLRDMLAKWLGTGVIAAAPRPSPEEIAGNQAIPIDPAELNRIAVTPAEQAEILADFMTQTRSDLAALHDALDTQNLPLGARVAHRMKGSSRMVGAKDLAALCETLEQSARAGATADVRAIAAAVDGAVETLEAHLASATGASVEEK